MGLKVLAGFRNDLENPIQNVIYNLERAFSENALRDIYGLVKTVCHIYIMTFMTHIKMSVHKNVSTNIFVPTENRRTYYKPEICIGLLSKNTLSIINDVLYGIFQVISEPG